MSWINSYTEEDWDEAYETAQARYNEAYHQAEARYAKVKSKALDVQVDGDHYKNCAIQPVEYITANGLGYCEGNIIKYVTRHPNKGNGRNDLLKAKHYIDILLETVYNESN